jgi:hypothetical protein
LHTQVYSAVAVRTSASIRFCPRFFFLYFNLFNVYFFSFPFGFSSLALLATYGLVAHIGLHFWDRFEVPALRRHAVSALHPRSSAVSRGGASVSVRTLRQAATPTTGSPTRGRPRLHSHPPPAAALHPAPRAQAADLPPPGRGAEGSPERETAAEVSAESDPWD